MSQLRSRIAEIEEENCILKKRRPSSRKIKSNGNGLLLFKGNRNKQYAKAKWAEKLGVSTSGYYVWLQDRKRRQQKQKALENRVVSVFEAGESPYSVDRICGILRRVVAAIQMSELPAKLMS